MRPSSSIIALLLWPFVGTLLASCESVPAEPIPERPTPAPAPPPTSTAAKQTGPTATPAPTSDPLGGKFTLADATRDLPGKGKLYARIKTEKGNLNCELYEDRAPVTVANFVGLARGLRPFRDPKSKEWVKRPGYDGTAFHRVIKGFMIQGGDPAGNGTGEPGYVIPDEIWKGAKHDRRGQLCMANKGPNTNGMQFFITDGAAVHLDGKYTIFGMCQPDSVIEALAEVEVRGDRAVKPPKIESVTITRGKPKQ